MIFLSKEAGLLIFMYSIFSRLSTIAASSLVLWAECNCLYPYT